MTSLERIQAAADAIQRQQPQLSKEQAFVRAMEQNPQLYSAYLLENPAQLGR